jgi:hypothetical protein
VEIVGLAIEICEKRRRGKRIPLSDIVTMAGASLIVLAVAAEGIVEIGEASVETKIGDNNKSIQRVLGSEALKATKQAVDAVNKAGGLDSYVKSHTKQIERDIKSLEEARARAEKQLGNRILSPAALRAITRALKRFSGTPFDASVNDDPDSVNLASQILNALKDAGWERKPFEAAKPVLNGIQGWNPRVGSEILLGLRVDVDQADAPKLKIAGDALASALTHAGLTVHARVTGRPG